MECPHIPELTYAQFGQRLSEAMTSERYPLRGSIELTYRCNVRCKHCYLSFGHTGVPGRGELSTSEIKGIIDDIVKAGTLYLLVTGGEPMMRRDFKDIYIYAKEKGLLVTLFTNGTMITPDIADMLADYRPYNVEITLYGYSQDTYENITGVPGSRDRCYQGIELLLERGIRLGLKSMVLTLNQHEIKKMEAFSKERGLKYRYDTLINSGLDGNRTPLSLRLKPDEIVQMDLQDHERVDDFVTYYNNRKELLSKNEIKLSAQNNTKKNGNKLYTCGAGLSSYHIDPTGKLSICMSARYPEYDLREGSFQQAWEEFIPAVRRQEFQGVNECAGCELRSLCSQCPGWSQLEYNNSETRVKFLCEVTHKRAKAFGIIDN